MRCCDKPTLIPTTFHKDKMINRVNEMYCSNCEGFIDVIRKRIMFQDKKRDSNNEGFIDEDPYPL